MPPSLRLEALREDLASRLRHVCADWPEQRFAELVNHIATTTLKYEAKSGVTRYDVRSTDALVERLQEGLRRSEGARDHLPGLAQGIGSIPRREHSGGAPPRRSTQRPDSGGA